MRQWVWNSPRLVGENIRPPSLALASRPIPVTRPAGQAPGHGPQAGQASTGRPPLSWLPVLVLPGRYLQDLYRPDLLPQTPVYTGWSRDNNAHLGNPSRERRSHFAVYFSAGFSDKTVPYIMNELYLTGATREDACAYCTMRKYSRKHVTQNARPSRA